MLDMYSANNFGNKIFKIVLIHLLKVIVVNLALDILVVLGSNIFFKIFFSSSI
jgi:hypothetical protein